MGELPNFKMHIIKILLVEKNLVSFFLPISALNGELRTFPCGREVERRNW